MDERVKKAIEYIQDNSKQELNLTAIARVCCISSSRFSHLFKKNVGISLPDYIAQERVNNGLRLLLMTEKTISEIAFNVGFESVSAFNKIFKRHFFISPSRYRQFSKKRKENSINGEENNIRSQDNLLRKSLSRRISMLLDIDEMAIKPFIKYCEQNNIELRKIIQELIVREQIKHCIDEKGDRYNPTTTECNDQNLKPIMCDLINEQDIVPQKEKLGSLYERYIDQNIKYIIGEFQGYKIIALTKNRKTIQDLIDKMIDVHFEESQIFAWVSVYEQEVLWTQINSGSTTVAIIPRLSGRIEIQ